MYNIIYACFWYLSTTHTHTQSPVQVGDYLEFLAETDLRVSASTCPQGDVSLACGGGGDPIVYPLQAQVYELETGLLETAGWKPSTVSNYSRSHGM